MKRFLSLVALISISISSFSQGAVQSVMEQKNEAFDVYCGTHFLTKQIEKRNQGFIKASNEMLKQISFEKLQKTSTDDDIIYTIPVVFHVVYNNEEENIPDSVIFNQVELLNIMFRRQNADTVNLREVFLPFVGDAKIEFQLADTDPQGNPTNGIVRTYTDISNFGGILPYGQGQNVEIAQWVSDSLMFNMFRLTETEQGGDSPWDQTRYLNIWTGDLRIFEPQFNNLEEVVFLALATPPIPHPNWPNEVVEPFIQFNQGVLVHYLNVGGNNPYQYSYPYSAYNGLVNKGKTLVHEIGHYLGLRHIWGDGDCSMHDYIWDTPNATNHAQFTCNPNANTCIDSINGMDLPDMIENYMDYASSDCQNSFTLGQIEVMREVLSSHRPELSLGYLNSVPPCSQFFIYPNPAREKVLVEIPDDVEKLHLTIFNDKGQKLMEQSYQKSRTIFVDLPYKGLFLFKFSYDNSQETFKVIRL